MKRKTIPAFFLALALVFSLSTGALAAGTTTATVPVTLTVSNEYRAVNVTVPAALPVYVINGTVVTADNARITNNAKTGSVQVTGLSVTDGAYKVGSYDSFSGSKTIALKINGCVTTGAGRVQLTSSAFPVIAAGAEARSSPISQRCPATRPTARTYRRRTWYLPSPSWIKEGAA